MPIVVTTRGPDGQLVDTPIPGDASPGDAAAAAPAPDAPDAPAPPGPEAQPAASSPAPPSPSSGEGEGEGGAEPDAPDETPITAGYVNRRIGQITRYRRQAERALETERATHQQEMAQLRGQLEVMTRLMQGQGPEVGGPSTPQGPPQAENYQSEAEWREADRHYTVETARRALATEQQQQQLQQALVAREQAFKAQHPDYDERVNTALRGKVAPHVQQALMLLPEGPALAYALAQQPQTLTRLNQLPPPAMMYELARLAPLAATPPAATGPAPVLPVSPTEASSPAPVLPPPPTPLSGSGQGVAPDIPADWSQAEFTKRWNAGWRPSPRDFSR